MGVISPNCLSSHLVFRKALLPQAGAKRRWVRFPPPLAGEVPSEARRRGDVRDDEEKSRKFAKQLRKNLTDAETILWSFLRRARSKGFHFRKQHPIGPYIADFACVSAMLTIEVDGATHASDAEVAYDKRRTAFLKKRGWHEIRVANESVYKNLDAVLEHVWSEATQRRPLPPSLRDGPPPPQAGEETGGGVSRSRSRGK